LKVESLITKLELRVDSKITSLNWFYAKTLLVIFETVTFYINTLQLDILIKDVSVVFINVD